MRRAVAELRLNVCASSGDARPVCRQTDLDALIATSDLQGIVPDPQTREALLMGLAVAEALEALALDGALPATAATGVIAGDLYSVPGADRSAAAVARSARSGAPRSGSDGSPASRAITTMSAGSGRSSSPPRHQHGCPRLAPPGRGRPDCRKPGKGRTEDPRATSSSASDSLPPATSIPPILHEGPNGDGLASQQPGNQPDRALVVEHSVPLTVCGHAHWEEALARLQRGQVLNVDARVVAVDAVGDDLPRGSTLFGRLVHSIQSPEFRGLAAWRRAVVSDAATDRAR